MDLVLTKCTVFLVDVEISLRVSYKCKDATISLSARTLLSARGNSKMLYGLLLFIAVSVSPTTTVLLPFRVWSLYLTLSRKGIFSFVFLGHISSIINHVVFFYFDDDLNFRSIRIMRPFLLCVPGL